MSSDPLRIAIAGELRLAVGVLPAVPRKTTFNQVTSGFSEDNNLSSQAFMLSYLMALERRHAFTLLDMSTVDQYGGSGLDFSDGVHLRTPGMDRLMNKVLQETGGTIP